MKNSELRCPECSCDNIHVDRTDKRQYAPDAPSTCDYCLYEAPWSVFSEYYQRVLNMEPDIEAYYVPD
jgi:hypothetical protein